LKEIKMYVHVSYNKLKQWDKFHSYFKICFYKKRSFIQSPR